jgi:uncharacterized protein YndB with AHSA1/START domain
MKIVPESAVVFVRDFAAPREKVWAFLTETARLPEWHGEGSIEPREGGAVTLMGGHIKGVVTAWRPHDFLAYTWSVFSPGESVSRFPLSYLEFSLTGATRLTLTHRPIPDAMQKQTAMGWHTMLDLIEAGLRGEFPKRADIFPRNAALYGVGMNTLKR